MAAKLMRLLAAGLLFASTTANAVYIITFSQVGSNVFATGSGSLNWAGLSFNYNGTDRPRVWGQNGLVILGGTANTSNNIDVYTNASGPTSFGAGFLTDADSASGSIVGIAGVVWNVAVPDGYVSGTSLGTSTATWLNETFATLSLTPGTYTWNWGTGATAESFTVQIGGSVPEPATLALLGLGLAGLGFARRKQ